MDRFLGNSVTEKQKMQMLLCTKLVFHRHYKSVSRHSTEQKKIGFSLSTSVCHTIANNMWLSYHC